MALQSRQAAQLRRIIAIAEKLLADNAETTGGRSKAAGERTRIRRSGKELAAFRKMLKTQRAKGVPVAQLARENGISSAYIYQLK